MSSDDNKWDDLVRDIDDSTHTINVVAASFVLPGFLDDGSHEHPRKKRMIKRECCDVHNIFCCLRPTLLCQAYRMDKAAFWRLHALLKPALADNSVPGPDSPKMNRNGAPNGLIPSESRLSMALRFFSGGSVYDIGLVHGVHPWQVYVGV